MHAAGLVDLASWVGRSTTATDTITPVPVAALAATFDHPSADVPAGTPLPPLWHWLYFLPMHRASELGHDGHAKLGGFLPPVPLPRRMWAGGQFEFRAPVCVADRVERTSTIDAIDRKDGRTIGVKAEILSACDVILPVVSIFVAPPRPQLKRLRSTRILATIFVRQADSVRLTRS